MTTRRPPAPAPPTQTVLDLLRTCIDPRALDLSVVLALEVVAADLGYGDIRPRAGRVAWIDELRAQGEKIGVMFSGQGAQSAVELAGIPDGFDAVVPLRPAQPHDLPARGGARRRARRGRCSSGSTPTSSRRRAQRGCGW